MQPIFQTTGIVGTGAMGRGIAQMAAQAGSAVLLFDVQGGAALAARAALQSTWQTLADKGRLPASQVQACLERIQIADSMATLAPCQLVVEAVVERLDVSMVGKKVGEGFYRYPGGVAQLPVEPPAPAVPSLPPVWVSPKAARRAELYQLLKSLGADIETAATPSSAALILVAPLGLDVTTLAAVERLDASRTIGIDMLLEDGATRRRVLATTPATRPELRDAAHALLASDAKAVSVIRDSAGFVTQRVLATMVNIAADMCQQGICTPADLDLAVTLGLGYPMGPLAMGNRLGASNLLEVLFNLQTVYGDPRYRPSPWLRRRAALGLCLTHEES